MSVAFTSIRFVLWATIAANTTVVLAQEAPPTEEETQSRIQQLIESRQADEWDNLDMHLTPSPPPLNQPIRHIPEWEFVDYVLLAIDEEIEKSFSLNYELNTAAQPSAVEDREEWVRNSLQTMYSRYGAPMTEEEEDRLFGLLGLAHTFVETVTDLSQSLNVLILIDGYEHNEDFLAQFLYVLSDYSSGDYLIASPNVHFIQVRLDSKWVRDYGPEFARDANGRILILDSRYEIRTASSTSAALNRLLASLEDDSDSNPNSLESVSQRLYDDVAPSFLALRLRQRSEGLLAAEPVYVVRPPIKLDGGDFLSNGQGVGFTSVETLRVNGGDATTLKLVFQEYFGLSDVVYLQPLPGSAIKHIDMFFQIVSPDIYLLGTFEQRTGDEAVRPLQVEAQRVLDFNEQILKSFFQSKGKQINIVAGNTDSIKADRVNIVRIPMPDVLRPKRKALSNLWDEEDRVRELLNEVVYQYEDRKYELQILEERVEKWTYRLEVLEQWTKGKSEVGLPRLDSIAFKLEVFCDHWLTRYLDFSGPSCREAEYSDVVVSLNWLDEMRDSIGSGALDEESREEFEDVVEKMRETSSWIVSELEDNIPLFEIRIGDVEAVYDSLSARLRHVLQEARHLEQETPRGHDIYRTYLNLLFVRSRNVAVLLLPAFSDAGQLEARVFERLGAIYSHAYGDIEIVPVESDYLSRLQGSIHCIAKSVPAGLFFATDEWSLRESGQSWP